MSLVSYLTQVDPWRPFVVVDVVFRVCWPCPGDPVTLLTFEPGLLVSMAYLSKGKKIVQSNSIKVESIIVENSIIVDNLPSTEAFYLIKIQNSRNSKIVEVFLGKVA